jgi:gas vesicle protein
MNYEKIISKILTRKSDNSGQVVVALVAGLAAGAILSILFAPESGDDTRRRITYKVKSLQDGVKNSYGFFVNKFTGKNEELEEPVAIEIPHFVNTNPLKRKKSDIKELVNEFHNGEHHNEQPIS